MHTGMDEDEIREFLIDRRWDLSAVYVNAMCDDIVQMVGSLGAAIPWGHIGTTFPTMVELMRDHAIGLVDRPAVDWPSLVFGAVRFLYRDTVSTNNDRRGCATLKTYGLTHQSFDAATMTCSPSLINTGYLQAGKCATTSFTVEWVQEWQDQRRRGLVKAARDP